MGWIEGLLLDDQVLSGREVLVGHAQSVGAGSEAVLHHDAVATDHVAGGHLLGDGRLAGHVGHFNNDVLGTEIDFLVELDAEVALEHGVREHVPVAVLQVKQVGHRAVVRGELAGAVLVAGFHVVVGGIRIRAAKDLGVVRREGHVVVAPGLAVRRPTLHVQRSGGGAVRGDLHEQDQVAGVSSSADIRGNHEPSSVDDFDGSTFVEGGEIDADVPEVVVGAVFSADRYPAVKSEGLVHPDDGIIDVIARSATELVLVERTGGGHVEKVLAVGEDGVEAVLVGGQLSVDTVGVAGNGIPVVNSLDNKLDVAGSGRKAEQHSGSKCEQILHVQWVNDSKD